MANYGYCPSGRLFEAAACGSAILSDWWDGLETFFSPQDEILHVRSADDVMNALSLSNQELCRIGNAAREHALAEHTACNRALELEMICQRMLSGSGGEQARTQLI